MKTTVYNLAGTATGEMELDDKVFAVAIKPEVVHEVFVAQMNNQREPWADTKNKGEVRGGGKKPWAQKGTGRARHGSSRSPLWAGGGVTFGPLTVRSYDTKINKKTRRLALRMCLTDKLNNSLLIAMEDFNFSEPKTKQFLATLKSLPTKAKSFVILTDGKDEKVVRMVSNLKKVEVKPAVDVNVMDMVRFGAIVASRAAIEKLTETLK